MNPYIKQEIKLGFSCHAGSEQMTPTLGGSHCQLCNKKVHDMIDKPREEVMAMIAAHPGGLCGKMSQDQFDHTLAEKLILQAKRPLRTWEIWLLALIFSFWFPLAGWGQSGNISGQEVVEMEESLEFSIAEIAGNCRSWHYQGLIKIRDQYFYELDSIERKTGNRGIEIIILKPFLYFHEGSDGWEGLDSLGMGKLSQSLGGAIASLDSILDFPWKVVNVHGHASATEAGDHEALALRRAQLIADWLAKAGLPNPIRVKSFGSSNPNEYPNEKGPIFQPRVEIILSEE